MLHRMTRQTMPAPTWCPTHRTTTEVDEVSTESQLTRHGEIQHRVVRLACGCAIATPTGTVHAADGAPYALGPVAASTSPADLQQARDDARTAPPDR
jgi:hypothetical protein